MTTPETWRQAGRVHVHRGQEVFYIEQARMPGAPAALVLIHGFPTSSWDWHKVWDALGKKFDRVIAIDMMGFGFSSKPARYDYSIFDQADLHERLLAFLGVERIHVLAHDYGDTVAQELLARHAERHEGVPLPAPTRIVPAPAPAREVGARAPTGEGVRVDSCALLNGGLFPETHRARRIQKLLLTPLGPLLSRLMSRRGFYRSFAAIFGPRSQPTPDELEDFWSLIRRDGGHRIMHRLIRYIPERRANRERWVGALQRTRVPLRVIDGPEDPVSGAHMVQRYRELVPNPDTVTLPGIGHYPQTEDPAGVLKAFLEFHKKMGSDPIF
jgi:pimeloyl-ACP methyl ester carboxylesterase